MKIQALGNERKTNKNIYIKALYFIIKKYKKVKF